MLQQEKWANKINLVLNTRKLFLNGSISEFHRLSIDYE